MKASLSRATRNWPAIPGVALLLVLAVSLGALHAGQPLHLHHGLSAGLYNEEDVLAALDSAAGEAPLPHAPRAAGIELAPIRASLPEPVAVAAAIVRLSEPRAPPLA